MTAPNLLESSEQEELYMRGSDTLLASWETYARGAVGAALHRLPGVAAAVFPNAFHLLAARIDGEMVAALAYDFGDDCGIYNVGTVEKARRRGLGTVLTAAQVHDARARGCRTASLQSTEMAERVYAAVGFRDLGRILEYVPVEGGR
jgi:GNAT superfamily N-acetyltransferase